MMKKSVPRVHEINDILLLLIAVVVVRLAEKIAAVKLEFQKTVSSPD